jgi:hypothetical protein
VIGKAQVIIAAESEQIAAPDAGAHAARLARPHLAPRAHSSGRSKGRESRRE